MENNFLKLFQIPETRQRILRTLGLLIAYRLGFQIPIPGMAAQYLDKTAGQGLFGLMSALSGRRARADDDLRARDHAVHLGVDHLLDADEGVASA